MSRTQNIKRNFIFNILLFVSQIILRFVLRTVLIYAMGAEYIGLNGLFSNIFGLLNLAELGIGSAIVFAMYKPIATGDIEKIKSLQAIYKKFYFFIALIVLLIGGILTPFLSIFINGEVSVNINVYILFLMYLFNSVVSYFSAHKRSLLLAYQRNDIERKICIFCIVTMTLIQILVLLLSKNYYLFFSANIFFTILECLLVHIISNKYFPEINGKSQKLDEQTKREITKNITALSMHKIGSAIVSSTDNILLSSFFGLVILGAYSNYSLIISNIVSLYVLLSSAFSGSVGNLVASCDVDYVHKRYKLINFMFSFLTSFCAICLLVLLQPFIKTWTKDEIYLLDFSTVVLICISFYLTRMRIGTGIFKEASGLFWKDRWKPIFEALINLISSIVFIFLFGVNGIFLGTILSTLLAPFWVEPYVTYKYYFKRSVLEYFKTFLRDVIIMIIVCCASFLSCYFIPTGGILYFVLKLIVCGSVTLGGLLLAYCFTPEFKECFKMLKPILNKIFKIKEADTINKQNEN